GVSRSSRSKYRATSASYPPVLSTMVVTAWIFVNSQAAYATWPYFSPWGWHRPAVGVPTAAAIGKVRSASHGAATPTGPERLAWRRTDQTLATLRLNRTATRPV